MFLSFDIRAIQRFIFGVPNLRCVIGASSLVADFDREVAEYYEGKVIYVGGGSGMLLVDDTDVKATKTDLMDRAAKIGVDLRIGCAETFSEAKTSDKLYPYIPVEDSFAGFPCSMSGLLPVVKGSDHSWEKEDTVHALVGMRREASNTDVLGEQLIAEIREILLEMKIDLSDYELQFFKNVNIKGTEKNYRSQWDDGAIDQRTLAVAGSAALGFRNRWAVIAMDGNDAGRQHQKAQSLIDDQNHSWQESHRTAWLKELSHTLKESTRKAFCIAAAKLIASWLPDLTKVKSKPPFVIDIEGRDKKTIVLPIRPLVIGGDDIVLLCHTAHAMQFVQDLSAEFSEQCNSAGEQYKKESGFDLWPASSNKLTISAGVLFTKNSYPLHAAIVYAESLLGSAKGRCRQSAKSQNPMPAAVDFDVVTDTLLDTPAARRKRELEFWDDDIGKLMVLTRRPYLLEVEGEGTLAELLETQKWLTKEPAFPRGLIASLMHYVAKPWSDRVQFFASHSLKHKELADRFSEEKSDQLGIGWGDTGEERSTDLIDAILLYEESIRDEQVTTGTEDIGQ